VRNRCIQQAYLLFVLTACAVSARPNIQQPDARPLQATAPSHVTATTVAFGATSSPTPTASSPVIAQECSYHSPSISADGRWIAYQCQGEKAIFVLDQTSAHVERIPIPRDESGSRIEIASPVISASGQQIAFVLFVFEPANDQSGSLRDSGDIFVYDQNTGSLDHIPANLKWGLGGNYEISISRDAEIVTFADEMSQVIAHERRTGKQEIVSSDGLAPRVSADGRWIAFASSEKSTDGIYNVYVFDRQTKERQLVSVNAHNVAGDGNSGIVPFHEGASGALAISADGRWIAFSSSASNLASNGARTCTEYFSQKRRHCYDVYVRDRIGGKTERVGIAGDGDSFVTSISADGRYISFQSFAGNLTSNEPNRCPLYENMNCPDIFVHDRHTNETKRLSVSTNLRLDNQVSLEGRLSADGRLAVFLSTYDRGKPASRFYFNLFLHDLTKNQIKPLSEN
jgi:Tol biopolymer transport system component